MSRKKDGISCLEMLKETGSSGITCEWLKCKSAGLPTSISLLRTSGWVRRDCPIRKLLRSYSRVLRKERDLGIVEGKPLTSRQLALAGLE